MKCTSNCGESSTAESSEQLNIVDVWSKANLSIRDHMLFNCHSPYVLYWCYYIVILSTRASIGMISRMFDWISVRNGGERDVSNVTAIYSEWIDRWRIFRVILLGLSIGKGHDLSNINAQCTTADDGRFRIED